jgi:hypothetical protein
MLAVSKIRWRRRHRGTLRRAGDLLKAPNGSYPWGYVSGGHDDARRRGGEEALQVVQPSTPPGRECIDRSSYPPIKASRVRRIHVATVRVRGNRASKRVRIPIGITTNQRGTLPGPPERAKQAKNPALSRRAMPAM